jgi:hypothetical protein
MTGGARLSGREGRGERGWAGPGDLGPGCSPGWAAGPFLYLFFCFLFLLFLISVLVFFLKMLYYSNLNKNNANHFCSLKSVFKTYKPKV